MSTKLNEPVVTANDKLLQIAHGYMASSALNAVARLGIADILAEGCLSVRELSERTGTSEAALYRVMRLLASIGVFHEGEVRTFANNDVSNGLRAGEENSCLDMVSFLADPLHFKAYADMIPIIRDGRTATEHVWNCGAFEVFADDAQAQIRFNNAMTNMTRKIIPLVLSGYSFDGIDTLVDVGGGHGLLLTAILQRYEQMQGIIFDLDYVVDGAVKRIESMGLSKRCRAESGDFFKSVPEGSAIIMKHIIHDWSDEKALQILQNCRRALNGKVPGKVLLVEMLTNGANQPHPSKFLDLEMLMLPGGCERSEAEYSVLFTRAGFRLQRVIPLDGVYAIFEAEIA